MIKISRGRYNTVLLLVIGNALIFGNDTQLSNSIEMFLWFMVVMIQFVGLIEVKD